MPKRAARRLSDALLRVTKAGRLDRRIRDGETPGLTFRVRPSGRREFLFGFVRAGRRSEIVLGAYTVRIPAGSGEARARALESLPPWAPAVDALTLSEARDRARRLRAFIRAGGDPVAEREAARQRAAATIRDEERAARGEPAEGSFAALAAAWLAYQRRSPRSPEAIRAAELALERDALPALGARPAGEITRAEVWAVAEAVAEGRGARRRRPGRPAPVGARSLVGIVSRIYVYALDRDFPGVQSNPAARLRRRFEAERRRDRVLSPAELRAFWEATEDEPTALRAFARVLLLTGLRRDELLAARWSELESDEHGTWLAVPATRMKSKRAHRAPLCRDALAELERLAEFREGAYLFPGRFSPAAPMREAYFFRQRLAAKVAALLDGELADSRPWTWHDLRRTARSLLAEAGASNTVGELFIAHLPPALRGPAGAYNVHPYRAELQHAGELLAARVRYHVEGAGRGAALLPFRRPEAGA
ncbi:MAG: integrase family protein [Thermoanaerobaculia bacterium]|nr:MAG: integrase family protein [Thermoanaerobaculia bacterium]